MDQDSAFVSSLMTYLLNKFNIKIKTVVPYNHQCHQPKALVNSESNPDIKVSRTFKEYYELLNKRIKYLQNILISFT